jgi:integrase
MTIIRVKGLKRYKDRHGKWRCYHRKTGTPIKAQFGTGEFFTELAALNATVVAKAEPKAGTLGGLIAAYKSGSRFQTRAARTRSDYQKVFDYLHPLADVPLIRFDSALVVGIQEKAWKTRGRRFANYVVAVLSIIFNWGKPRLLVNANPAEHIEDIQRPRDAAEAHRVWTDSERHAVLDAAPAHVKPAMAIMMYTGLGPKDTLTLPRTFYRDGRIATKRSKTGHPVYNKPIDMLREVLDLTPKHDAITLCAHSRGQPWTESGFNHAWQKLRSSLEKEGKIGPGLTLYGLRHTHAATLRELGYDERTIADVLGQETPTMALHYAKQADLRKKMDEVSGALNEEMNRRQTEVSNPAKKLSNLT